MEHHSNFVPWQLLCQERGARRSRYVAVDDDGRLELDELDATARAAGAKLVAVAHVSNVLGTINAGRRHRRAARTPPARWSCVDGSQAVPQMPVDVGAIGADFYAWTGHKAYGPTGIGVLHGRRELLEAMPPFLGGGHMISTVALDAAPTWAEVPAKFEAGTPPVAEAIGLGAAVGFLEAIGMDARARARARPRRLRARAPGRGAGPDDPRPARSRRARRRSSRSRSRARTRTTSPRSSAATGVCVRAGHHCAQPLMRASASPATTRASFAVHNTREDVDAPRRRLASARGLQRCFGDEAADGRRLYREEILDHYKRPRNWGELRVDADLEFEDTNPLCGDELKVHARASTTTARSRTSLLRPRLRDLPGRRRRWSPTRSRA